MRSSGRAEQGTEVTIEHCRREIILKAGGAVPASLEPGAGALARSPAQRKPSTPVTAGLTRAPAPIGVRRSRRGRGRIATAGGLALGTI